MNDSLAVTYKRTDRVFSSVMPDGQYAILDAERSIYFGLNPVAARLWDLLGRPETVDSLVEVLVREFDVTDEQCRVEVARFLSKMAEKGLVDRVE